MGHVHLSKHDRTSLSTFRDKTWVFCDQVMPKLGYSATETIYSIAMLRAASVLTSNMRSSEQILWSDCGQADRRL